MTMAKQANFSALEQFSVFIARHLGLHFPRERWDDLQRGIASACADLGFESPDHCVDKLLARPLTREQLEILASHLTIGETYFFREKSSFDALEKQVLPELIRTRRGGDQHLRLWSAGCSTGEEAYSLAMLVHGLLPDLRQWNVTILATDINARSLAKAASGNYSDWSFRGTPASIRKQFFTVNGQRHELLPHLRHMVTFAYLNLAEDAYPSLLTNTNAMDIIFCRNVLMYFTPGLARNVLGRFHRALVPGGWLSISPCDAANLPPGLFESARLPGVILHKKEQSESPAAFERAPARQKPMRPVSRATVPLSQAPPPARRAVKVVSAPSALERAGEFHARGQYTAAVDLARRHLAEHPRDVNAMDLLARACANQGRLGEALEWCDHALSLEKLAAGRHLLRATILQEQGQADEAIAALKRVLYLDPGHPLAQYALGNVLHQQKRNGEAASHFGYALELLSRRPADEVLPEAEGMTAGRLREVIQMTLKSEVNA